MSLVKIFSGSGSKDLALKIAECYGIPLGLSQTKRFSDGELHVRLEESVRGCDVFFIQSTVTPSDNLIELLIMIDAAKRASAEYITIVLPYYGYARQDRKDMSRVAITAKLMANLFSAAGADRMMTIDLHADQIQGFFEFPVDHLLANVIFVPYLESLKLEDLVIAAPDAGGSARAIKYAKKFEVDMVICDKQRKRANEIDSMQVIGNVEGKNVVIIDDLIDTAGTICKASDLMIEKGAKSVRAICTHGVLSGNAFSNIENSKLEELLITDSIPLKQQCDKIKVLSVAPLFANCIKRTHENESITELFTI